MTKRSLEKVALEIFGSRENPAYLRWVSYWQESQDRNTRLLGDFERRVLLDFSGKRVLDVGCGTGGLADILSGRCRRYCGIDSHSHVLQFAAPAEQTHFVQGDAAGLPFPDQSFDLVFAFDIVEHLAGGREFQRRFFRELKRILSPLGMIFLTTPNYWYPYDAHSNLYLPQFIPGFLRDRYIQWRNPDFLKEHKTFASIQLLTPRFLRKALDQSELSPLHDLPCCLDYREYRLLHPILGLLVHLGLGWYFHAEFWTILVHRAFRHELRWKLRDRWFYEQNQPSGADSLSEFSDHIDFERGMFNHQLGPGWYWYERDRRGFRWTKDRAFCYLQSSGEVNYVHISGYSPIENRLDLSVDGVHVGEHGIEAGTGFELKYLMPFSVSSRRIFEICIETTKTLQPQTPDETRDLAVMIFSVRLS